jgi:hypothetical protein
MQIIRNFSLNHNNLLEILLFETHFLHKNILTQFIRYTKNQKSKQLIFCRRPLKLFDHRIKLLFLLFIYLLDDCKFAVRQYPHYI